MRSDRSAASDRRGAVRRRGVALPIVALLACATVLRAPVSVVPPLATRIADDLALSQAAIGALTSIPVLCFGLVTPLTSQLVKRWGVFASTASGLGLIVAGSMLRSLGGVIELFSGAVLIGVGISIGNVAVPVLIGRRFPDRVAAVTGAYSATINVAVTASTAFAVPLAVAFGWRAAAAVWGIVLGVLAFALWTAARTGHRRRGAGTVARGPGAAGGNPRGAGELRRDRRQPRAFVALLAGAFSGHTLAYYAITSWLPSALSGGLGMSESAAGAAASVFQLAGIAGPFLVPFCLDVLGWGRQTLVAVLGSAWLVLPVLLVVAPSLWLAGSIVSGAAQGAFFTAVFVVVIERSGSQEETRRVSTIVQSIGYTVAALGPIALGWLHDRWPDWGLSFGLVAVVVVAMTAAGVLGVRSGESGAVRRT